MIDEHRQSMPTTPATQDPTGRDVSAMAAVPGALSGEVQDSVDPYDYAETIVRDLALHVGTRLRDFRDDLAAMHATVVQLPETLRVNAMGQSIQDLRERVAHLTSVVSLQTTRPAEEAERVGRGMNDLAQRVSGLEAWIAAAKRAGVQNGELPSIPLPDGGLVGMEQFDRVIDQMHESFVKLVSAVRELQLDLRDLRTDVRDRRDDAPALPSPPAALPPRVAEPVVVLPAIDPAALERLSARVAAMEGRLGALASEPAQAPMPSQASVAAPAALSGDTAQLAALAFGSWHRLSQPTGSDALQSAIRDVLAQLAGSLPQIVRQPQVTKGSGLVAVASGRVRGVPVVALVATEDLCGHNWTFSHDGVEMAAAEPAGLVRTPCWRALLASAALIEQTRPDAAVVPVLIYGNGRMDRLPTADEVRAHGQANHVGKAAGRLIAVAAPGVSLPGLLHPSETGDALAGLV